MLNINTKEAYSASEEKTMGLKKSENKEKSIDFIRGVHEKCPRSNY
ncbi:MAG: hypothetical protein MRQ07_05445 [Candidatus Midichloria sp.]|nr:hypothetical protein [Candidatus Midichloria sp.]